MDSKLKQIDGKDCVVFTLFGQSFLYSANSVTYFPITECARKLFLNSAFKKNGELKKSAENKYSETEVKKTKQKVEEFYKNDIVSPPKEHPFYNLTFGDYTLKLVSTLRCNLHCKYCFADKKSSEFDMSFETAKKAIDYFLDNFCPKDASRYIIDLTGSGEPLLRLGWIFQVNDYVLKIKKERKINIFCQFATNGMLLSPETSKKLKEKCILFGVSLDGEKEACEKARCGLDYDKVSENINRMENKDFFGLAATYSGENHNLVKIFKALSKFNPEVVGMKPVRLPLSDKNSVNLENISLYKKSYDIFVKWLYRELLSGNEFYWQKFIRSEDFFNRFLKIMARPMRIFYRCSSGLCSIAVDAKENIIICPAFIGQNNERLGTLDSGIPEEVRRKFESYYADKIDSCKNCWARYACAGECFAVGYSNYGKLTQPNPAMCELKKYLIQLAVFFWSSLRYERPELYRKTLDSV